MDNFILKLLNENQYKAATSERKKICVIAGPGCGKTRALIYRTYYLIKEGLVNPENILLLTFSKRAIHEIKERIRNLIGYQESLRINIYNFHSFCYDFLTIRHDY
jgi:DNA helicase-2/ATP-dependent DNA helicase PcrA